MQDRRPYDSQLFMCLYCKHRWWLLCYDNRLITDDEFKGWIEEVKLEHKEVCTH